MRLIQRKLVTTDTARFAVALYARAGGIGFFAQLFQSALMPGQPAPGAGARGMVESTLSDSDLAGLERKCRALIIASGGPIVSDVDDRPRQGGSRA